MSDKENRRATQQFPGGVSVHFAQDALSQWRVDWLECNRLLGNPLEAIAELGTASDNASMGPSTAVFQSSPVIRAADMGWEDEAFSTFDEACEFVKPRLPRFA